MSSYADHPVRDSAVRTQRYDTADGLDIELDESAYGSNADDCAEAALLSHHEGIDVQDKERDAGGIKSVIPKRRWGLSFSNTRFTTVFSDSLPWYIPRIPRCLRRSPELTSDSNTAPHHGFCAFLRMVFNYPEPGIKLRNTAWLDALRGLAAFNVFIYHWAEVWIEKEASWGKGPGNDPNAWWRMPFLRAWFDAGSTSVCLFFSISGYVLTRRIIGLIRQRRTDEVLTALSSGVMRRGIRLYMPIIILTFILMNWAYFTGIPLARDLELETSYPRELVRWYLQITHLWMPLRYPDRWAEVLNIYDGTISWTIPLEYYSSITVWMAVLLTARITKFSVRIALFAVMIYMYTVKDEWYVVQFLLGAIYAEYQLVSEEQRQKNAAIGALPPPRWRIIAFRAGMIFCLVFGLYMAGMPGHWIDNKNNVLQSRPFYDWMTSSWIPRQWYITHQVDRFFWSTGANCILVAFGELETLRCLLNKRPFQYLGRLSFGLYLCHMSVRGAFKPLDPGFLHLFGLEGSVTEQKAGLRFAGAYWVRMIVATPVNFFVAGLFERWIDKPSVNMGKSFEKFVLRIGDGDSDSEERSQLPVATSARPGQDNSEDIAETGQSTMSGPRGVPSPVPANAE